ncbi:MAG: recombinase family protein [Sulfuricurvum sp.]|nr:recombinase family protein [Sulfuricurvum sp.]MDP3023293.1 recombinase family protein [Sulfuricurvum sp.]
MVVSYIRSDKDFESVIEQLKIIGAYCDREKLIIDKEMIDQAFQNKRIAQRQDVVTLFRSLRKDTLLVYDTWVLSINIEDIVQMLSCLLRNEVEIHFVKQGIVIDRQSDTMVVLGLIDQLRQTIQNDEKKEIGRPKGSKSSSKFDLFLDQIITELKQGRNVSDIARILNVSRSSLKDYVESRALKELVRGITLTHNDEDAEAMIIGTIKCPSLQATIEESM